MSKCRDSCSKCPAQPNCHDLSRKVSRNIKSIEHLLPTTEILPKISLNIEAYSHRYPPSSSIVTPFPCLYKCTVGSWQLYRHQLSCYTLYSRQSSYTDREKSSYLMTKVLMLLKRIYLLWFNPSDSSKLYMYVEIFVLFSA